MELNDYDLMKFVSEIPADLNFKWIAGGDGEEGGEESGLPGGGESGESGEGEGDHIPVERFNEVYGKSKQYEARLKGYDEFGDPDSIREKFAQLKAYDEQVAAYKKQQSLTEEQKNTNKTNEEIRSQLLKVFPELKNLEKISDVDSLLEHRQEQTLQAASNHLGSTLTKMGASLDEDTRSDVEDFLLSKMTEKEMESMLKGNFKSIDAVLERSKGSRLLAQILTSSEGDKNNSEKTLPARHKPGGAGGKKKSVEKKSWGDLEKEAFERLSSGG